MKKDDGLSELVYEYYESRILFGHYRYGEQLLSVSQICSSFQVGRNTVLAALQKLEENGYIATEERKVARIAYQGTEDIFKKKYCELFRTPQRRNPGFCSRRSAAVYASVAGRAAKSGTGYTKTYLSEHSPIGHRTSAGETLY